MDIKNVRNKFKHFGTLSIAQLAAVTKESIADLQFVITELEQKGKIAKFLPDNSCGGNCSCSSSKADICSPMDELYKWVM